MQWNVFPNSGHSTFIPCFLLLLFKNQLTWTVTLGAPFFPMQEDRVLTKSVNGLICNSKVQLLNVPRLAEISWVTEPSAHRAGNEPVLTLTKLLQTVIAQLIPLQNNFPRAQSNDETCSSRRMAQHFHSLCFHQQVLPKLQTRHGGRHKGVTGGSSKDGMVNRGLALFCPKVWPLCCTSHPWKEHFLEEQDWLVQNLALLTPGAELEFSQALSTSKLSSIGHSMTKTTHFQLKHNFPCNFAAYSPEQSPVAAIPLRIVSCLIQSSFIFTVFSVFLSSNGKNREGRMI